MDKERRSGCKVTKLRPEPEEQEEVYMASFPNVAVMQSMLGDKRMVTCVVLVVNEEGQLSHYVDGANIMETVGMLESMKLSLLGETYLDE